MELKFEESATSAGTNCINSNQIKSATDKTGKFGPESNSILCAIAERDEQKRDEAIENLLESPGMFIKQGRRLKKAEAKKIFGAIGRATNQSDGTSAQFSKNTIGKLYGHGGFDFSTIIESLKLIYEQAQYLGFRPESPTERHVARKNIIGVKDYLNKFEIIEGAEKSSYLIRFSVRESTSNKEDKNVLHSAFVSDFEIYKEKGVLTSPVSDIDRVEQFKTPSDLILIEYLNGVKERTVRPLFLFAPISARLIPVHPISARNRLSQNCCR